MYRFGMTTIARWLAEELPEGVRAYIEDGEALQELVGVVGVSGRLVPKLKMGAWRHIIAQRTQLALDTPVILSLNETLAGRALASISTQIDRAACGSFAMPRSVTPESYDLVSE